MRTPKPQEYQMKNLASYLIVALSLSWSVQAAQPGDGSGPDLALLTDQLQLDSVQASQLTSLVARHRQAMQSMRGDKKQLREKMQQVREQHREDLLTVLNYEQLYQFDQYMRQFHHRHRKHKAGMQ